MVFSLILNDSYQVQFAGKMWSWVKDGGGILRYEFNINNPMNKDARGNRCSDIKKLCTEGKINISRITLAPPACRHSVKLHPIFYGFFNCLTFLRTYWLCCIQKQ